MYHITLIDSEKDLCSEIIRHLEKDSCTTAVFFNGEDALEVIDSIDTDLMLMELLQPGIGGVKLLSALRNKKPNTPIVIGSSHKRESDMIEALYAGADDYLTKPFSMELLSAKINTILRRYNNYPVTASGINIDMNSHQVTSAGKPLQLTQKEFELLVLFVNNPHKIYTRNQLLNNVWGYSSGDIATRTVDAHIATLRKKLESKGRYICTVPKIGYLWEPSEKK